MGVDTRVLGGNTITTGCMGIMSAVASGIANMPESITTIMTTMVMNTTTIMITRISPWQASNKPASGAAGYSRSLSIRQVYA
jgi:hypothetical protein